jgi:hypothetical protein
MVSFYSKNGPETMEETSDSTSVYCCKAVVRNLTYFKRIVKGHTRMRCQRMTGKLKRIRHSQRATNEK